MLSLGTKYHSELCTIPARSPRNSPLIQQTRQSRFPLCGCFVICNVRPKGDIMMIHHDGNGGEYMIRRDTQVVYGLRC